MCKLIECNRKANNKNYGGFCSLHKKDFLTYDQLILYERFTGKSSDYLKTDILHTLCFLYSDKGFVRSKVKKEYLFNTLKSYFEEYEKADYKEYLDVRKIKIIKELQKSLKERKNINLRGIGYIDKSKCNNETDFFTYDRIDEIDDKYFFSYKDKGSFIWFFDIRSFNRLIEMGQGNPYTMAAIPKEVIDKSKLLSKQLNITDKDNLIDLQELILTKKQILKQKTIDIFSQMEQYGYGCNIDWFLRLNVRKLKTLYKNMEDIWNYRLNLTNEIKSSISPPNGIVFNIPVSQVLLVNTIEDLQEIILNEIVKFNNAINEEYKKLGYMYFLLGLGIVSIECYQSHQWLMHAIEIN